MTLFDTVLMCYNNIIENCKPDRETCPVFLYPEIGGRKLRNEENLIPFNKRTEDEQREIARKGGIASGASRRAYKSLKQAAKVFFKENDNAAMEVIQALYSEALNGNVKAVDKLQDLIGETVQREELALRKKAMQQEKKEQTAGNNPASKLYEILGEEDGTDYEAVTETEAGDQMGASAEVQG